MKKLLMIIGCLLTLSACKQQGKNDTNKIVPENKDSSYQLYDNHPPLDIPEREYLNQIDSIFGVKGIKMIDYRNNIYQYKNTRIYWNKKYDYFLYYTDLGHGIESDMCDGNQFVNKDSSLCVTVHSHYFNNDDWTLSEWFNNHTTSLSDITVEDKAIDSTTYYIKGKTISNKNYFEHAVYRKAYGRDIIVYMILRYTDEMTNEADAIIYNNDISKGLKNYKCITCID